LQLAGALGNDVARINAITRDAGPSAGCWALIAALAVTLPARRWRWIVAITIFLGLALAVVVFHRLFDLHHLVAATAAAIPGTALGPFRPFANGPTRRPRHLEEQPERPPRNRVPVATSSAYPPT